MQPVWSFSTGQGVPFGGNVLNSGFVNASVGLLTIVRPLTWHARDHAHRLQALLPKMPKLKWAVAN